MPKITTAFPRINIMFFGDSMFNGEGSPVHLCWVNQVSKILYDKFIKQGVEVVCSNASVSGDTTRTALLRMAYHTRNKNMNIFVTQFGMNDICEWETEGNVPRVSYDSFNSQLSEILSRAQSYGTADLKTVLLTNPPSAKSAKYCHELLRTNTLIRDRGRYIPNLRGEYISIDHGMIRATSKRLTKETPTFTDSDIMNLSSVEYFSVCQKVQQMFLLDDHIHLNSAGHQFYFSAVYPVLLRLVKQTLAERA